MATPIFNSPFDFQALSCFVVPESNEKLWDAENLARWGVDEAVNPFALAQEHPASYLRLTHRALKKFVWNKSLPLLAIAPMTKAEKVTYDGITRGLYRGLVRKVGPNQLAFNMDTFRQLSLVTTWVDFKHVQHLLKADKILRAIREAYNGSAIAKWVKIIASNAGSPKLVFNHRTYDERQKLLTYVLRSSPRLRALIPLVTYQVLVLQEKAVVWCLFPAQQVLVAAVLQLGNIDVQVLHAGLSDSDQKTICRRFDRDRSSCPVLVCSYSVNPAGLNLQHLCQNVHLFDTAGSQSITEQAIGRVWRLGQVRQVKVYSYNVPDSFNSRQMQKMMEERIPGLIMELNRAILESNEGSEVELGRWCRNPHGELVSLKVNEPVPDGCELLNAESLACLIHEVMGGIKE
ncbi:hypothetical protein PRK78_004015 [Emydomyces testavorans]|uniref:Helicase C-terminal domain-containing protein n=1 Tax=Emydomyces testavorans TaxID=2070801 RepID=A0AAF0DH99_9EURO|nr:hypothetical protein PRK78_004015 [Emydomyces testavorans]